MARRYEPSAELRQVYAKFANLLRKTVDVGVVILDGLPPSEFATEERLGPMLLYRNLLAKLDGATVLINEACVDALAVVLRTAADAFIGLKYMLQDKPHERSMAYLFTTFDELRRDLQRVGVNEEPLSEKYDFVREERQRVANLLGRRDHEVLWYSMFPTSRKIPTNIRHLAEQVGEFKLYQYLYQPLSRVVHGTRVEHYTLDVIKGTLGQGLRFPRGLQPLTAAAVMIGAQAAEQVVRFYVPDLLAELHKFLANEVKPGWERLRGPDIIEELLE